MKLAATLMAIYILGGGQEEPGVTVVTEAILDTTECREAAQRAEERPPVVVDSVSGRPVIMTFFKCVNADAEMELEKWQTAVDTIAPM